MESPAVLRLTTKVDIGVAGSVAIIIRQVKENVKSNFTSFSGIHCKFSVNALLLLQVGQDLIIALAAGFDCLDQLWSCRHSRNQQDISPTSSFRAPHASHSQGLSSRPDLPRSHLIYLPYRRNIRISYDLVGFIPVDELMKQETA